MKYVARRNILLAFYVLLNLTFAVIIRLSFSISQEINIGSFVISANSLRGILSSLQSITCVLMVFANYKVGIYFAGFLSINSLISSIIPVIKYNSLSSLPGAIGTVVSFIILIIIYSFYKKASISSITDYVTGLENRRSYETKVTERLKTNKNFAIACIEIEDFKHINNTLGMPGGDYILKQIAKRLSPVLEDNDILFTITGPTFAILFNKADSVEEIKKRLQDFICPHTVSTQTERFTVSLACGIIFVDEKYQNTANASQLLRNAETALLAAHKENDEKIAVFNEKMENDEEEQKRAERLIHESLENDYFYLVYQPQYYTSNKKLRGFETLIRCRKPDGNIISPLNFIPAAEKTNLIMKIDDYVLRRAMKEFKTILDNINKSYILSINVSAKNIGSENFAEKVKALLLETSFPAENLEIEITEYSFADSMKTTIKNILELKEIGVQIALDDFGTGYTSIAQLMKLPVNLLKIDKSLIDDIETNQTMRDMIDSVIYMGHIMNCEVISEGVENDKQIALLKEHNCDFIQGFVWGKPQSLKEIEELCNKLLMA
ncbi:MAG: bifunctional diguanylate cyclase/phosphodiesterase [Treponema sp.]|nr:bifunctional diguanylate cyclase/phosphodiesterase [Treponema sp.]